MAYKHGVNVSEVPTSLIPPVEVSAGIPFVVGTAPVNMADVANVNKPVLCGTYAEAVAAFGYVPPKADESGLKKYDYSISEFIHSQFALFGVGPVIIVNVLDPAKHKVTATTATVTLDAKTGSVTVAETGIIPATVNFGDYAEDVDYVTAFDDDGNFVITSLKNSGGAFMCETGKALSFTAEKCDPSAVTAEDIIGGVDTDGKKSGLELVEETYPRFRMIPGIIVAPGYSSEAGVAAVMAAKAANINSAFTALALIDTPDTVKNYSAVPAWKNDNNITDGKQVVCFPKLALDGVVFHQSSQLAGLLGKTDGENDDVPYASPSNHNYQMNAAVLDDGTEVFLSQDTAAYLNGQGVVTALNFSGGWKCWGNRTAAYPANSDVKDSFIPVRRMFSWIGNSLIEMFWSKVDAPLNRRQIDTIVDSANIWLNGLSARQYILGGRVEFNESENSTTDLMDGKAVFNVYITPPSPNREIQFKLEYDPQYISALFE